MGLYGPFTAVAGKVQQCNVDAECAALFIRNTSIYDLAVAFQAAPPPSTTTFGGPPYYTTIPAGDRAGVRIPLGVYGGAGFPGYVWILPVNNTTGYALTGTVSGNVAFSIESYSDAALMPGDYASAQFINAASQQRTIEIPVAPGFCGTNQNNYAAGGTDFIMGPIIHDILGKHLASITIIAYLHYFNATLGGANYGQYELDVIYSSNWPVLAEISRFTLFYGEIHTMAGATSGSGYETGFYPAQPHWLLGSTPANCTALFLSVKMGIAQAFPSSLRWNFGVTFDSASGQSVPQIGQTIGAAFTASPTAPVF